MRISLKSSGGFANIQLHGQVDTDEFDISFAQRVLSVLTPDTLKSISEKVREETPDVIQYEIGLFLEDGFQSYVVDDLSAPQDVHEVIQEILKHILEKKRKAKKTNPDI